MISLRKSSLRNMDGRLVFLHLVLFCIQFYARAWDLLYVQDNSGNRLLYYRGYPGKMKYLTFWCQVVQMLYFGLCVLNDIFGSNHGPFTINKSSKLQRLRDYFLAAVAYPVGLFVVLTFWLIYAVDRELVFPKHLDQIIPSWLNHVMHTTVILFLLIEKFFVYHNYPSRKAGLTGTVTFASVYLVWVFWIAFYAHIWVYPILEVLSWPFRATFIAACWVLMITLYLTGEAFTKFVWKPTLEEKKIK